MEDNINILYTSRIKNRKKRIIKKKRIVKRHRKTYCYLLLLIPLFLIVGFTIFRFKIKKNINQSFDLKNIHNVLNYSLEYEEFDENINEKYFILQNHFCERLNENINQELEDKLRIANIHFNGKNFKMFVYKGNDILSNSIITRNSYEADNINKILKALDFYAEKNKIEKKDIYLVDIGAHVGWYTYFFGKYGFKIISFEASKINGYILYKNFCLNRDVKVTLINKGLDTEDKKCNLQIDKNNNGNGIIICENRDKSNKHFIGETFNDIELTKLSRYSHFLSGKNFAFMKLDVEGSEGIVIKGGKELISEYHVPFIMIEFEVVMLEFHGTNIIEFLRFFENNGYKLSRVDFLSKQYVSSLDIINNAKRGHNINIFIVYEKFLD